MISGVNSVSGILKVQPLKHDPAVRCVPWEKGTSPDVDGVAS